MLEMFVKPPSSTVIKTDEYSTPLKLTKEMLGRVAWSLLHTMAAAYPFEPTEEEKQGAIAFLNSM